MNRTNRSPATTALASVALMLLGCAVGILIGRWTVDPPTVPAPAQPDPSEAIADLRSAIREDLKGLREQVQAADRDPGSRQPVSAGTSGATSDLDRLRVAVEKLNGILESHGNGGIAANVPRTRASEPWKGPGYPAIDILWQRMSGIPDHATLAAHNALMKEFTDAHRLWSRDDLFARYGAPLRVETRNNVGLGLIYESPILPGWVLTFSSTDGVVTSVTFAFPRNR